MVNQIQLYAVRDARLKIYKPLMCFADSRYAAAFWEEIVNDHERRSDVAKWPSDFSFYHMGEFNQETGQVKMLDAPTLVSHGSDVVKRIPSQPVVDR